jgi:hypothetical protein
MPRNSRSETMLQHSLQTESALRDWYLGQGDVTDVVQDGRGGY